MPEKINAGIITISDRASQGVYVDQGGPAVRKAVEGYGWQSLGEQIVPDEKRAIQKCVRELIAGGCQLVFPEALREIADRELPGFGETMRMESMKITPNAILSRSLAVAVDQCLVIALPGKPSGAVECLGFVHQAIPHCVKVLQGVPTSC